MDHQNPASVSNTSMAMSRLAACMMGLVALALPRAGAAAAFTIDIVPRKAKSKLPLDRVRY